jgi:hypothetical protein
MPRAVNASRRASYWTGGIDEQPGHGRDRHDIDRPAAAIILRYYGYNSSGYGNTARPGERSPAHQQWRLAETHSLPNAWYHSVWNPIHVVRIAGQLPPKNPFFQMNADEQQYQRNQREQGSRV